jgi:hypothetical protein
MASYSMNRMHFLLIAALCLLISADVQAQPMAGIPWTKVPFVVIVAKGGDARVPLVHAAVAHWNSVLAGIGSAFRLGLVSQEGGGRGGPGKIVVVSSDGKIISHTGRSADGQSATVMIRTDRVPPLSLPNVARNVIAHELGHSIGLGHNSDPTMLMCGRPAPCRPDDFASSPMRYFPLSGADQANLLAMYPGTEPVRQAVRLRKPGGIEARTTFMQVFRGRLHGAWTVSHFRPRPCRRDGRIA